MTAVRLQRGLRPIRRDALTHAAWAALALAVGLAVARLPLSTSVVLAVGLAVLAAAFWEPAIGLGLSLALGTARAYISAARPDWPADWGQILLAIALCGWLARGLVLRRITVPHIPLLLPLALFSAAGWLSMLSASSLEESLKEALKWGEVAAVVVLVVTDARRGRAGLIVAAILLAGVIQAGMGIWQYQFRGTGPSHFAILGTHYRAYGTFEQPNPYAGFLGLVWPLAAGLAWAGLLRAWRTPRRLNAWLAASLMALAAVFILAGLYVSFSRGAWLGAGAAALALALALPRRRWLGAALVLTVAAGGWGFTRAGLLPASITNRLADVARFTTVTDVRGISITSENFALVERLAHWQAAESMAQAYPWLGVGLGNYAAAYPKYALLNWVAPLGHAHMIYLNVLAETGLFGLAAYLVLWACVFAFTIRAIHRTDGLQRGLALGLLGAWTHLSAHQIVDNLYVNNIPLTIGALLGLLAVLMVTPRPAASAVAAEKPSATARVH